MIVSADLRIRRFTPMAEKVLNLIPADLGRPIGHIKPNIDCPNLEQLIAECDRHVSPLEREVQDRQGRWFSLRIRPYKNVDNRIDGAVLALFDIDGPKRSEERARAASDLARCVVDLALHPIALADAELRLVYGNAAFAGVTVRPSSDLRNQRLEDVLPPTWDVAAMRALLLCDTGSVARQVVRPSSGRPGPSWAVEARAMASQEAPGQHQVLIVATPHED